MKISAILSGLVASAAIAGTPAAIPIDDDGVFPESIAAAPDGTVYIGTMIKGTLYRAMPSASVAKPWIDLRDSGVGRTMGLIVDPKRKLLWACTYPPSKPGEKVPSTIATFDLATGAARHRYAFEGTGCNDMAIAADGTVYASDFSGAHIMRLAKHDTAFRIWSADPG